MKTLLLMRHAKSDWDADYGSDHDRPLNDRGQRSARLMGRVLADEDLVPDLIISSTAVRARRTAELAIEAGAWDAELVLDRSLYDEGPRGVLESGASAPDVNRVMLVGHQPTWSMLVSALTGERADLKTATVAVIELDLDSWAGLPGASGNLTRVLGPKTYDLEP
ncbi:MAG TPA: histidine phosphatase family protein [Acidimicrobiia bacterium]|nr:histidine phosphatase family protein [Acidimicrobiia bacterium]